MKLSEHSQLWYNEILNDEQKTQFNNYYNNKLTYLKKLAKERNLSGYSYVNKDALCLMLVVNKGFKKF